MLHDPEALFYVYNFGWPREQRSVGCKQNIRATPGTSQSFSLNTGTAEHTGIPHFPSLHPYSIVLGVQVSCLGAPIRETSTAADSDVAFSSDVQVGVSPCLVCGRGAVRRTDEMRKSEVGVKENFPTFRPRISAGDAVQGVQDIRCRNLIQYSSPQCVIIDDMIV
ncbi:hypothetical protein CBL_04075 [Carabus blaptoides fortunei]